METKKTFEGIMQQVLDDQTVEDILHGLELMTNPAMSSDPDRTAIAVALYQETLNRLAGISNAIERLAIARAARDAYSKVQTESLRAVEAACSTVTLQRVQSGKVQLCDVVLAEHEARVAAYTQPIPTWAMELACHH